MAKECPFVSQENCLMNGSRLCWGIRENSIIHTSRKSNFVFFSGPPVSLQEDFLDVNFQWRIFYEGAMFSLPSPKRMLNTSDFKLVFPTREKRVVASILRP